MDHEISQSLRRLKTKTAVALPELETFVRQKNLGWQAAGVTSTIGRILDEYADSTDQTASGEALTPSGYYKNIINVVSLSILQGAYVASGLYKVEDLQADTDYGPYNVDMVAAKHGMLSRLESLSQ